MVLFSILPCNLPSQLSANLTCPASPFILIYGEAQILLALRIQTDRLSCFPGSSGSSWRNACWVKCLGHLLPDLSIANTPYYFVHWGPRAAPNNALSHWVWGTFLGELIDCAHAHLPMEADQRSFFAQLQIFEAKEIVTSQSWDHQST